MLNLSNLFRRMDNLQIKAKKLSQDTGISTGNISDWKNGRSVPSASKLLLLADYLDCSVDYLLGRADNLNEIPLEKAEGEIFNLCDAVYLKAISTSVTVNEILSTILRLNEFGKTKVLEYAKDLSVNALYKANNSPDIADSESSAKKQSEVYIAANEKQSIPPTVKKKPRHT